MTLLSDLADTLRAVLMLVETGYPIEPILPDVKGVLERVKAYQSRGASRSETLDLDQIELRITGIMDSGSSYRGDDALEFVESDALDLVRELTAGRDAARAQSPPVPLDVCGTPNECGSHCHLALHHPPPCLCVGDVGGVPGTCGA